MRGVRDARLACPGPYREATLISLEASVAPIPEAEIRGDGATSITGLAYDSRDVGVGDLFFCVPGGTADGHAFAADAIAAGAAALVVDHFLDGVSQGVPQVLVPSVRAAMGPIAAEFHGNPSRAMIVVGITGTNGKTTTTYLLESIFRAAGLMPGVIGTTGVRINGAEEPALHTTPEAPDVHALLARMLDAGVGAVAMEVSSHGLDQHRVGGVHMACAAFTNLTQDHLDYHDSMETYFAAKALLFTSDVAACAVIEADGAWGKRLVEIATAPVTTFGMTEGVDIRATNIQIGTDGVAFDVNGRQVTSPLRGQHNVENCLTAFAVARAVGIQDDAIVAGLAQITGVPGRMESVDLGQPFAVLVDYAHTPDGVENVLHAARAMTAGQVIVVVGCGGDRDRSKRLAMARAATSLADLAILTSDNPRSEDPMAILDAMEPGAREGGGDFLVVPDRREAIRQAVASASAGDVVIIAGKGHETGQESAGIILPFDDRIEAADAIREVERT